MDRRDFFGALTAIAGVAMPKVAEGQLAIRRGATQLGTSSFAGCTGPTHVFMGPTGPADYRLIGNLSNSLSYRGQSLVSPEALNWMRRHYGIVLLPVMEQNNYVVPEEYIYRDGFFDIERARAAWRADNIAEGRDPEYCLHFLR